MKGKNIWARVKKVLALTSTSSLLTHFPFPVSLRRLRWYGADKSLPQPPGRRCAGRGKCRFQRKMCYALRASVDGTLPNFLELEMRFPVYFAFLIPSVRKLPVCSWEDFRQ